MNPPDRPALRSRPRSRSALPRRAVQSQRNVHRQENGKPMNAAEFRCLEFSFFGSRYATEPPLRIFAHKLRKMPVEQSLIDPRFNGWVVHVRLSLANDATQFKSITARDRFKHVPRRNA